MPNDIEDIHKDYLKAIAEYDLDTLNLLAAREKERGREELIPILSEEYQDGLENLTTLFKPEAILNIDELNLLCNNPDIKKTELMIIHDRWYIDEDLAAVIRMRARAALDKNNQLVLLSFNKFHEMMQDDQLVPHVTKLSFLHHVDMEFGYIRNISSYINHLPNLKEIVLRGCSTANPPAKKPPKYKAKITHTPYENDPPIQGINQ